MNKEFKRMIELAGLTEIKVNTPPYDVVRFLNINKNAIFDDVSKKYPFTTPKELEDAKKYLKFEANNDGVNTVYSTTIDSPNSNPTLPSNQPYSWEDLQNSINMKGGDYGVFASLFVSPDKKQFIEQILYDFGLNREEEINWEDEDIEEITPFNVGGRIIYYTIVEY
jgi:uncharacterized protein (DUF433 family)